MSEKPREDWSSGRMIRTDIKSVGPFAVDCSGWDKDTPAERWSKGKLRSVTRSLPLIKGFTPADSVYLEIVLKLDASADPAQVFTLATRLLADVIAFDPTLKLTYDPVRSRAEEGRVTIALNPGRPGTDITGKLDKITAVIRKAAGEASGVTLNGVRIRKAG